MTDPEIHVGDDGEIEYEYDSAADDFKPKRKPRRYRTVQLPVRFILPVTMLLLLAGGALLVSNYQFALCSVQVLCYPTPTPRAEAAMVFSDSPPLNESRIKGKATFYENTRETVRIQYTDTPENYNAPACGPYEPAKQNGRTIMFTAGEGDNAEIFTIHGDGSGLCRLTNNLIEENLPAWSPNSSQILFGSYRADSGYLTDIFVMDWNATVITNLTKTLNRAEYQPVWSPDGKQIAFITDADKATDRLDIYVMNADGTDRRNITNNPATDQSPRWSPDGQSIAFISDRDNSANHFGLYLMNVGSTWASPVNFIGTNVYSPVWSPEGRRIVFHTDDGIWMITPATSSVKQLSGQGYWPFWSPDGRQIAFQYNYSLYTLSIQTGASPRVLTYGLKVRTIAGWR